MSDLAMNLMFGLIGVAIGCVIVGVASWIVFSRPARRTGRYVFAGAEQRRHMRSEAIGVIRSAAAAADLSIDSYTDDEIWQAFRRLKPPPAVAGDLDQLRSELNRIRDMARQIKLERSE